MRNSASWGCGDNSSIIVYEHHDHHLILPRCSHWSAPSPVPIAPRLAELLSLSLHLSLFKPDRCRLSPSILPRMKDTPKQMPQDKDIKRPASLIRRLSSSINEKVGQSFDEVGSTSDVGEVFADGPRPIDFGVDGKERPIGVHSLPSFSNPNRTTFNRRY